MNTSRKKKLRAKTKERINQRRARVSHRRIGKTWNNDEQIFRDQTTPEIEREKKQQQKPGVLARGVKKATGWLKSTFSRKSKGK